MIGLGANNTMINSNLNSLIDVYRNVMGDSLAHEASAKDVAEILLEQSPETLMRLDQALSEAGIDELLAKFAGSTKFEDIAWASDDQELVYNEHQDEQGREYLSLMLDKGVDIGPANPKPEFEAAYPTHLSPPRWAAIQALGEGEAAPPIAETTSQFDATSPEVSDLVNTISSLASQASILAINAAVEAARAGEQGRGFALVADEVRAQMERFSELVKESTARINVDAKKVESIDHFVSDDGSMKMEIVALTDTLNEICAVMTFDLSQRDGMVGEIVGNLDHVTQQNAALAVELAVAAKSLEEQAKKLTVPIGRFRLTA